MHKFFVEVKFSVQMMRFFRHFFLILSVESAIFGRLSDANGGISLEAQRKVDHGLKLDL